MTIALGPFMVFLVTYIAMFFAAFYLFGQQQVGFNYYYKKNQDELESGMLHDCASAIQSGIEGAAEDCAARYAE